MKVLAGTWLPMGGGDKKATKGKVKLASMRGLSFKWVFYPVEVQAKK